MKAIAYCGLACCFRGKYL